ncbi:MAG: NAD/NADP octopine/nopaline dehydrogenase family protein [Promethearchaeota archaeon]
MNSYKIAIFGDSGLALLNAAYLTRGGHVVRLWVESDDSDVMGLLDGNTIMLYGEISGSFEVFLVTNSIYEAIDGADLIIVAVSESKQEFLANQLAQVLQDFQVVLLQPGFFWGAIMMQSAIKRKNPELRIFVGELNEPLFRYKEENNEIVVTEINKKVIYCFYPEIDNNYVDYLLQGVFNNVEPVDDIMITSLWNFDELILPVVALFHLNALGNKKKISLFETGINLHVSKFIEKVDLERCRILESLGMKRVSIPEWYKEVNGLQYCDYYTILENLRDKISLSFDSDCINNFFYSNIKAGLGSYASLGRFLKVETPVIDTLVSLSEILWDFDFNKEGRSIENLNIPLEILKDRGKKMRSPDHGEKQINAILNKMFDQILDDLKNGWVFIQAPRELVNVFKEYLHSFSGKIISPDDWKQYFESKKKSLVIAMAKKNSLLKDALQLRDEFDSFFGFTLYSDGSKFKVTPILFHGNAKKEAEDFIDTIKNDLSKIVLEIIIGDLDDAKQGKIKVIDSDSE